jgi:error-prone DNA polymerase
VLLVLVRQPPETAGEVCSVTIEDEYDFSKLIVFQKLFETYKKDVLSANY